MRYNKEWGKSVKVPEKRKHDHHVSDPLKRGSFKLTPAFVKFIETNVFNRKTPLSKPKSVYRHGLRVLFAECDQYLVLEIAKIATEAFKKHTAAHSVIDKGYFDFAFANSADADEASKVLLQVNGRFVPTIRTCYAKDTNLFVGFDNLPCTIDRDNLLKFLKDGLQSYGEVIELELNRDPLFFNSSSSRGYAIINPLPNINENINLIPRYAHFTKDNHSSSTFRVLPERAPSVCAKCQHIGHTQNACPNNLLSILKIKAELPDQDSDSMEDTVDGDSFLDIASSEDESQDISELYAWGELASYKFVEPTTKEQRREAQKAAKELVSQSSKAASANTTNVTSAPTIPQPTITPSSSASFEPTLNPFGEVSHPIASAPRKRGRPVGTTKSAPAAKNPVGCPKKDGQVDTSNNPIGEQQPSNGPVPMDQDEQDKSYHIPHYENNPAHYDPAIPAITQNLEAHSQANGPSQY